MGRKATQELAVQTLEGHLQVPVEARNI